MAFPLTPADFTAGAPNTIDEEWLQQLLDAAAEDIVARAGPTIDDYVVTDRTETFKPSGPLLMLSERATSIVEVLERAHLATPTTLEADDYQLSASGNMLRRGRGGSTPAAAWRPLVSVTYVPYSDNASRARVQAELVKLDIAFQPGLASQTIGSWTEAYTTGGPASVPYSDQRASLLASLHSDPVVMY